MDKMVVLVVSSFAIALISNIVMKYTTDQHKMKSLKERMDSLRKKMKSKKDDVEAMKKIMEEQNALVMEQMRLSMKSLFYNMIFIIPAFYFLKKYLDSYVVILPFNLPWVGSEISWLYAYIFYAIIFSILTKKLLKITY